MRNPGRFVISNNLPEPLTLNIEPEGVWFPLPSGEKVSVLDMFKSEPVTIVFDKAKNGNTIVSIWPGDGELRVEKDGENLFDLIQSQ